MTTQATRNKRRGRKTENKINDAFGATRQGLYGGCDGLHSTFSLEIKDRKRFAGKPFMEQSVTNAPSDRIPIVIVHITGDRHENDLVMIRMKDWKTVLKEELQ